MSLESLLRSVKRKAAAGLLGLSLALSPIYGCGSGEGETGSPCSTDSDCKGERVCEEGYCGDGFGGKGKYPSCSEFQDCNELVAATLFYSCGSCCIYPQSTSDENFYYRFNEEIIEECTFQKEDNIQNSKFMRECLETDQASKKLLGCWCRASKGLIKDKPEVYNDFPRNWQECRDQYDR